MAFIAYTLPIVPGQSQRARDFGDELAQHPGFQQHYEELNRHANVRRHMEWVQETPMGDFLVVVFETDTPEKVGRPFTDSDYDDWWTRRVEAVHGFDPAAPEFKPVIPRQTWDWHDEVSTGHS
jgi:hypothetical protein